MFMKLGQFLSALCGEKFVSSPATRSYSSDGYDSENDQADSRTSLLPRKGDEGLKSLIYQSSKGIIFQLSLKNAAKKVVEDCSKNYEPIIDSSEVYNLGNEANNENSTIPLNEAEEKPLLFESSRGLVLQGHIDPAAKEGNVKPLADQKNKQRDDVGHYKKKIDGSLKTALLLQKEYHEEKPLILKSSRGPVFQVHIDPSAKEGNRKPLIDQRIYQREGVGHQKKRIDGSLKTSLLLQKGDEEKPLILKSLQGSVFQVHIDHASKKGNGKPLDDQKNKQRKDVGHYKKKIDSSLNTALLLHKVDEEKPLILKSSRGPVFQVHIDPSAKKGNGKPLPDQKNKQRKEVDDHHKDVAINKPLTLTWRKKVIVEDSSKNKGIIKSSNVTKKEIVENLCKNEDDTKEIFEYRCKNEAIIQSLNLKREIVEDDGKNEATVKSFYVTKNEEIYDDFRKYYSARSSSSSANGIAPLLHEKEVEEKPVIYQAKSPTFQLGTKSTGKDENGSPLNNQGNVVNKNKAINKSCTWKVVVKDDSNNEPIINGFNSTKKKNIDENKEIIHMDAEAINKTFIVEEEEEKNVIFQEPTAEMVDDNKPQAVFCDNQVKEIDHPKKKKKKKAKGLVFQVRISEQRNKNKKKKEIIHMDAEAINKTLIVEEEEEKTVIFQEQAAEMVDDNKPKAEFCNDQVKEIDHPKDLIIEDEKSDILQALKQPDAKKSDDDNNPQEINHHNDETIKRNYLGNNKIVWLKHYNNKQRILMVGEGDFSFSASLAVAFGSASKITATSLNTSAYLRNNYMNASENIEKLTNGGATIMHGIDATKMSNYPYWQGIKFDRIIYNFPYSGCPKTEPRKIQLRQHLELVRGFLTNAKEMLEEGGEIHISHKTNSFHSDWKLKELALLEGLLLVEEAKFDKSDYPGYETKQGYHGNLNFDCYPSSTFMFASIPI